MRFTTPRAALLLAGALFAAAESPAQNVVTDWTTIASSIIVAKGGKSSATSSVWFATIVRMTQTGTVVAVRRVRLADGRALGRARLNGIAISPDFRKIWVTVTGRLPGFEDREGAVLEVPAF